MALPQRADLGTVALRPVASPVDTYVRPAAVAPGLGQQLAAALQEYQPQIKQFLAQREEKKTEEETASARKQALIDGIASIKDVNDGKLHPDKSALWQKVYKDQQGRAYALAKVREARTAYEEGGYANQTDPIAFDEFARKFVGDTLAELTDSDLLNGAIPAIDQELTRLTLAQQQATAQNQKQGYLDAAATEIDGLIANEYEAAATEGRDFDPQAIWGAVNALKVRSRGLGMLPPEALNKLVVDTITDYAERNVDETVLEALKDQTWTDDKGKAVPGPFTNAYGLAKLRDSSQRISARKVELANAQWTQEQRAKQAAREDALALYASAAATGRRLSGAELATLTQQLGADFLTSYNSILTSLNSVVNSDRNVRDYDSPEKMIQAYHALLTGNLTLDQKASIMGELRDPQNISRFYDDAKADKETGRTVFKTLRNVDDGIALLLDDVAKAGVDESVIGKALGSNPDTIRAAKTSIARDVAAFAEQYPEVLTGDRARVRELQDLINSRIKWWKDYAASAGDSTAAAAPARAPAAAPANVAAARGATAANTPAQPSNPFIDGTIQ